MYGTGTDPFGASIRRRIAELGEGFVGREWLAQMVVNELNGASAAGGEVGDVVGDASTCRFCSYADAIGGCTSVTRRR